MLPKHPRYQAALRPECCDQREKLSGRGQLRRRWLGSLAAAAWLTLAGAGLRAEPLPAIQAVRCPGNPLITPELGPGIGANINGPSVIRTPDWLPGRLGRYYLYFASHRGRSIRLAYADNPCGPWTLHAPGTLRLAQAPGFSDHIASPDVHVDEDRREIRLYVHGRKARGGGVQRTGLAVSPDGLHFRMVEPDLGSPYFRLFSWEGSWWALAKEVGGGGRLYRAPSPRGPFRPVGTLLPEMRHAAVLPWREGVLILYSRIGDAPERIVASWLNLKQLQAEAGAVSRPSAAGRHRIPVEPTEPLPVLEPETAAEGADLPLRPSRSGATRRARQLRDPAVLVDGERLYLFYALAGESGIGGAELPLSP